MDSEEKKGPRGIWGTTDWYRSFTAQKPHSEWRNHFLFNSGSECLKQEKGTLSVKIIKAFVSFTWFYMNLCTVFKFRSSGWPQEDVRRSSGSSRRNQETTGYTLTLTLSCLPTHFTWGRHLLGLLQLIGWAYLPIILCGSWHQQKCAVTQRNLNPLHISVVTLLLLNKHKHIDLQKGRKSKVMLGKRSCSPLTGRGFLRRLNTLVSPRLREAMVGLAPSEASLSLCQPMLSCPSR